MENEKKPRREAVQTAICAGMLAAAEGIFRLWPEGGELLRSLLLGAPATAAEQALMAAAERLRAGEGLYEGIAVYCAELLSRS